VCLFVWRLPFDLSSKGDPAISYTTAGIALRVRGVLKPPHDDKVETPTRRLDMSCGLIAWTRVRHIFRFHSWNIGRYLWMFLFWNTCTYLARCHSWNSIRYVAVSFLQHVQISRMGLILEHAQVSLLEHARTSCVASVLEHAETHRAVWFLRYANASPTIGFLECASRTIGFLEHIQTSRAADFWNMDV
jgi:hypothetical protein